MKKKIAEIAFLVLFFTMLLIGTVTIPIIHQDGSSEKRLLAEAPSLWDESGRLNLMDFPSAFEEWLNDHIGLRSVWMQQYASLHALLNSSVNDQVIWGESDWLYYEPTISDYTGVDTLDENARWRVKYTLEALNRALNGKLIVFFAPNKNTVIPQHMPSRYPVAQSAHTMEWLIENAEVEIIDSVSALSDETLYFHTDTHWNAKGARIGAALIIDRINALTGASGTAMDPEAEYSLASYTGDLAQMLFPNHTPKDSQMIFADSHQNYKYVGHYRTPEDMTITTAGSGASLNVLVLRDSFSNALIEPLSNAYANVQYRRAMPLPLKDAESFDVVVLEMVERRISELLEDTPKVWAIGAEPWTGAAPNCTAKVSAHRDQDGVLLYGCLSESVSHLESLTVCVTAHDEAAYYEAFPVCAGEFSGDGCFALYLKELAEDAQVEIRMAGDETLLSDCVSVNWVD